MSSVLKICFLSASFFLFSLICSFNSQEHKIVADVGMSRVVIPSSVVFPDGVKLMTTSNYLSNWQDAKMLAVGFKINDQNDYDKWKKGVQDNCYWYNYGQLEFNRYNYIETDNTLWPTTLLNIDGIVGDKREPFSFGDLVAIYGDYRRTVIVDNNADCFLTNDKNGNINFSGNTYKNYCPTSTTTIDYLHKTAFGLCPPYGSYGNVSKNTAGDAQYDEAGWWGDEMLRIANVNETHFSNVAIAWYIGMHRLALMEAEKAVTDNKYWKSALHYEANALHSLTDLFSLGHAVTNRDECSFGAMKNDGLQQKQPALWMENVIKMGGGTRNGSGILSLSTNFAPSSVYLTDRKDFMPSYLGSWAFWGVTEHSYHDYFNDEGASVRNFNGDKFQVYGDFKLHDLNAASRRVIENAVTASVQSLFDTYVLAKSGIKGDALWKGRNKDFFNALKYAPVFIEQDRDNTLNGMWLLYAGAVKTTLEMGAMPKDWEKCKIPFLSGKVNIVMASHLAPCTTFK